MVSERSLFLCCAIALFTLAIAPPRMFAQGTDLGAITGTVSDPSGAGVINASVVITDLATASSRPALKTNEKGEYTESGLRPGRYRVSITAPGFATLDIAGVLVQGSATSTANAALQISNVSATVDVTAQNPPINAENQTISTTLGSQEVTQLPRDSRDVYQFLYLNPNITQSGTAGDFKFLGAQSYGASMTLDGQRTNGGIFGQHTQSEPSLEGVSEITVQSSDFSAEYAGIGNIRVTSKRGTDQYHGSLIYDNENSAVGAWSLQDKIAAGSFTPSAFQDKFPAPHYNINDLGGSFGGRVPKLKNTWFFTSFERNWTVEPIDVQNSTLPHPALWAGDFSGVNSNARPTVPDSVLNSLTPEEKAANTFCVPDDSGACSGTYKFNQIPQRLLNPTVQKLIQTYYPAIGLGAPMNPANGRVPNFATLVPARATQDLGTIRLDHNFSDKDQFYAVYHVSDSTSSGTISPGSVIEQQNTGLVVPPYTGLGLVQTDRMNHTVSLSYTRIIAPTLVNELRGGFNMQNLFRHSNTTLSQFLSSVGFGQAAIQNYGSVVGPSELSTYGQTQVSFSNTFATLTNGGRNTDRPLNQNLQTFGDTITWNHGGHNIRIGGDLVRNQADDGFTANRGSPRGALTYTGSGTTPFADFLSGLPPNSATYITKTRPPMNVYDWEQGYFIQDDWKVTSRLTLNLGLRYELDSPFIEQNDLMVNLNPNYVNSQTGQQGILVVPSRRTLAYLDPRLSDFGVETASQAGVGRGLVRLDKLDLAPRVGLAWRIGDKNVLRGGWGFYYPTPAAQNMRDALASNAFNEGVTARQTLQGWPTSGNDPSSPISGGTITGNSNSPSINAIPFGLRQPRIQQYNVTFERDLGWNTALRLSYLGTTLHGLIAGKDLDQLRPNNTPFGITTGDGVTTCDPYNNADCTLSAADLGRLPFPSFAEFVLTYGNYGHGQSNAFQAQVEHRFTNHLQFAAYYTLMSQKSTALDTDNSSLGGIAYNVFSPDSDYGDESFVSRHRFVAYGIYDLPVGRDRRFGANMPKWLDAIAGGWQTTFNLFAKSGTPFTPVWLCDDCDPVEPGNIAVGSIDATGDFNAEPSFRPTLLNKQYSQKNGDTIWNASSFGLPSVGSDLFSAAKRNLLWGPGTLGVNLGVHKDFSFTERVRAQLGADIDNLFNHPLLLPDANYGAGGGAFTTVGDFALATSATAANGMPPGCNWNAKGPQLQACVTSVNPTFGSLFNSFSQEGIAASRQIRFRLRITF